MASVAECRCCGASSLATRWPVSVSTPEKTCCFERGLLSDCVLKTRTPPRNPERSGAGNPSRRRARRGTGPLASERPCGPLPPIEASGTGVWAWVHLAFHGRCTTAAAGLAREGRGRHKCPAPLPLAVPPLLRSAQLPLALHSRARATRAPVTASGCSATAGATTPPKAAAAKKRRAAALRRRCCNKRVGGWEQK